MNKPPFANLVAPTTREIEVAIGSSIHGALRPLTRRLAALDVGSTTPREPWHDVFAELRRLRPCETLEPWWDDVFLCTIEHAIAPLELRLRRLETIVAESLVAESRALSARSEELLQREAARCDAAYDRWKTSPGTLSDYDLFLITQRDGRDAEMAAAARERGTSDEQHARDVMRDVMLAARRREASAALRPARIVFRTTRLESLNVHAIELAVRHQVSVDNVGIGGRACASSATRTVHVPPVTNEQTYATFLHEVGHLVSPEADSRQHRHQVVDNDDKSRSLISVPGEIGAWRWAVEHAKNWTSAMQDNLAESLRSYADYGTAAERVALEDCVLWASRRVSS